MSLEVAKADRLVIPHTAVNYFLAVNEHHVNQQISLATKPVSTVVTIIPEVIVETLWVNFGIRGLLSVDSTTFTSKSFLLITPPG